MNLSRLTLTIFALLTMTLGACAFAPKGEPMPSVTFVHLEAIPITVQAIQVANRFEGEVGTFVIPPEDLLQSYIDNRFLAMGNENALSIVIEDASVKQRHERAKQSFARFWDVGGAEHYDVVLRLRIEHRNTRDRVLHGTVLTAQRRIKVSEHLSVAEREQAQLSALEGLFGDIDQNMRRIVLEDMKLQGQ